MPLFGPLGVPLNHPDRGSKFPQTWAIAQFIVGEFPFLRVVGRSRTLKLGGHDPFVLGTPGTLKQKGQLSRGTFPILSRDPSFKKTSANPGKTDPVFGKRTVVEENGKGTNP